MDICGVIIVCLADGWYRSLVIFCCMARDNIFSDRLNKRKDIILEKEKIKEIANKWAEYFFEKDYREEIREAIRLVDDVLRWRMVPNCLYRGMCFELNPCYKEVK